MDVSLERGAPLAGDAAETDEAPLGRMIQSSLSERRLVGRLMAYWRSKCVGGRLPSVKAIDPDEIGPDWRSCFLIDTTKDFGFANFSYLGPLIAGYEGFLRDSGHDWRNTAIGKSTHKLQRVLTERAPMLIDDELTLQDGRRLMFRSVMLPLSEDQTIVHHVMGAANGKVL